jgi:hypothetical protein
MTNSIQKWVLRYTTVWLDEIVYVPLPTLDRLSGINLNPITLRYWIRHSCKFIESRCFICLSNQFRLVAGFYAADAVEVKLVRIESNLGHILTPDLMQTYSLTAYDGSHYILKEVE